MNSTQKNFSELFASMGFCMYGEKKSCCFFFLHICIAVVFSRFSRILPVFPLFLVFSRKLKKSCAHSQAK